MPQSLKIPGELPVWSQIKL